MSEEAKIITSSDASGKHVYFGKRQLTSYCLMAASLKCQPSPPLTRAPPRRLTFQTTDSQVIRATFSRNFLSISVA